MGYFNPAGGVPSEVVDASIVIPLYDEVESLPRLVEEIGSALMPLGIVWEVIFVDDGSTDGSGALLLDLSRRRPEIRLLRFPVNRGQSAALAASFRAARGRVIVTHDADLQNDPADIPKVLAVLDSTDAGVVSGIRKHRRDTWSRRVSSRVANAVRNFVLHDGVTDVGCSLKAYRAELVRDLPAFDGFHRFVPALARARGAKIVELEVSHRPRRYGRSKYGIAGRMRRGIYDLIGVRWLITRQVDLTTIDDRSDAD